MRGALPCPAHSPVASAPNWRQQTHRSHEIVSPHLGRPRGEIMAQSYQATCTHCGYQKMVVTGGTRRTFATDYRFPALCFNCDGLAQINLFRSPPVCYECNGIDVIPYGDKTRNPNDRTEYSADDFGRLSGRHSCPLCVEYGLTFNVGRFID